MATIPASAIVDVTPNVLSAGGSALDLIGLLLSNKTTVPIDTVATFATASDVGDYFGADSDEYKAAVIYFNGFDNSSVKPGKVLFAQYNPSAVSAYLRGGNISGLSLDDLKSITGTLIVVSDGFTYDVPALDLSAASSFSTAATIIQDAVTAAVPVEATCSAGSIAGTTLTVGGDLVGVFAPGLTITGGGGGGAITANSIILSQIDGVPGGAGTYLLSQSSTVTSEAMTASATIPVVTYSSVSGAFVITSGITGAASTAAFATGTTAALLLFTQVTGAVLSAGAPVKTPAAFMNGVAALTQDWVSFMTVFNPDNSGNANKLAFAAWANDSDNRYCYVCVDTDANPTTTVPATTSVGYLIGSAGSNYSGTCLVWDAAANHYYTMAAFVCGSIASLDVTEANGRATFAFRRQAGLVASVTNATVADNLIANGYNFYGAYATANDQFVWLYPGSVSGDFEWLDSYIDQIWLSNSFQQAWMVLLQNVKSIPYNPNGYALIEAAALDPIFAGVNFGAIRANVTLSAAQAAEVNTSAGKKIDGVLATRGWYLQIVDAQASIRQARQSPPIKFFYMDGEAIQIVDMTSILVQ